LLSIGRWNAYRKEKEPDAIKAEEDEGIMKRLDYRHTLFPYMGVRKLRTLLQGRDKMMVGRKRIKRLMEKMGIYAVYPKPNLSKPGKENIKFPYLLKNKTIQFPNQVWSLDITYIPMKHGFMYLTVIIDWYSRFVVGYTLADTLDTDPIIEALIAAMEKYGVPSIINSDQGSQFTSDDYTNLLRQLKVRQSMDGKARWVDNVIIERWFRSLKTEDVYINEYASPRELSIGIKDYVTEYNTIRPHQAHANQTPESIYYSSFLPQIA
jgi:putative transposase